uniref:Uncharacterized protein n=1 Tax=Alexandrium monilatum TaxID=311494 RepID=A0A7S4RJ09_9DINO
MARTPRLALGALLLGCLCATGAEDVPTANCLCLFDIDRTLTGKQGTAGEACPNDRAVDGTWDAAYGGGVFTLSELSAQGISTTFCRSCYLGLISAGGASGHGSKERAYIEENILTTGPFQRLAQRVPSAKAWSHPHNIASPLVVYKPDRTKQYAVEGILAWYASHGVEIWKQQVHFFGDRTENIEAFRGFGYNAREVSCDSRDWSMGGVVGLCGAAPLEIVGDSGVYTCADRPPVPVPAPAPPTTEPPRPPATLPPAPAPVPPPVPTQAPSPGPILTTREPLPPALRPPAPAPVPEPKPSPAPAPEPAPSPAPAPTTTQKLLPPPAPLPPAPVPAPEPAPTPAPTPEPAPSPAPAPEPAPTPAPVTEPAPAPAPAPEPAPPGLPTSPRVPVPLPPAPAPPGLPTAPPAPMPLPPAPAPPRLPAPSPPLPPAPVPPRLPATTRAPQPKCSDRYCPRDWVCCRGQCHHPRSTCCGHLVCPGGWRCYGGNFCFPNP